MLRGYPLLNEVGNAVCQYAGLPGTGACYNHDGPIGVCHSQSLNVVEGLEVAHSNGAKIEDMLILLGKKNVSEWNYVFLAAS